MTITKKTTHVAEGLARLLEQYKTADNLKAVITAYLEQIQEIEAVLFDVKNMRDLDTYRGSEIAIPILDGDMELVGVANWLDPDGSCSKSVSDPHSGVQCLKIESDGSGNPGLIWCLNSFVIPGKRFHFVGWAKGDGAGGVPRYHNPLGEIAWTGTDSENWQLCDVSTPIPKSWCPYSGFFGIGSNYSHSSVFWDDIVLSSRLLLDDGTDNAQLDCIGSIVGEGRADRRDQDYLEAIETRILLNSCKSTGDEILGIIHSISQETDLLLTEYYPAGFTIDLLNGWLSTACFFDPPGAVEINRWLQLAKAAGVEAQLRYASSCSPFRFETAFCGYDGSATWSTAIGRRQP